ncbi:MAG: hypothetical protein H6832_14190 [Planctomycetes bacterium]|nr:hypothetical protein [Planctomycetota bacterium]MCB9919548.1 hypothetical protein [Planctomycetota bacterium]
MKTTTSGSRARSTDEATFGSRRIELVLLVVVVLLVHVRVLTFAQTPEGWSQLSLLRQRTWFGSFEPFPEYPYYRPLWFAWLSLADRVGLSGGLAHVGPLLLHLTGVLAVYRALVRIAPSQALAIASCVGIAPGLTGAMSWLAAGNKAFVFGFLAIGFAILLRVRSGLAYALAVLLGAMPAIASSENGYLAVLLFPLTALALRPRTFESAKLRIAGSLVIFVTIAACSLVHLLVLSPQRSAGAESRVVQLIADTREDPIGSIVAALENFGRFFAHGIGVGENLPWVGALLLAALTIYAIVSRRRALLVAIAIFVVLNVPASLFRGESSRHHAYLPAIGAAACIATFVCSFRGGLWVLPLVQVFFIGRTFELQRPWADYCAQSQRIYESSIDVLRDEPLEVPLLINVPIEYRAAFHLRFGAAAKVSDWPSATVLSSRDTILLPEDFRAPDADRPSRSVLEYDGSRLVRTTLGEVLGRRRAPRAFCVDTVRRFERPWLAWGETLRSFSPFSGEAVGFEASPQSVHEASFVRRVDLDGHGPLNGEVGLYWECTVAAGAPCYVVLGWTPWSVLPTTENAWLFTLEPLPWAFTTKTFHVTDGPHGSWAETNAAVLPVYGFLPAVPVDEAGQRLRVELRLR